MILLDTHVLVWLDEASLRLGAKSVGIIDTAFQSGKVAVSAISFWEVGMLIRKRRIRLEMDLRIWRDDFMRQGLIELPISGDIGIRAASLEKFHGDPADRLIVATALHHTATLMTADERILSSEFSVKRLDARL